MRWVKFCTTNVRILVVTLTLHAGVAEVETEEPHGSTYRPPQEFVPEDVLDNFNMESSMVTSFLQENYLNFFTDLEDIAAANEYLSDSDILSATHGV